jgi:hypothetical protein
MIGERETDNLPVPPNRIIFLNEFNLITFQSQTCQPAGRISARVDVDAVVPHVGFPDRGVAMDDNFFERLLVQQKFISYPKQIVLALARQGRAWPHSRMHKEKIPAGETEL